jgi:hypothetical protein
VIPHLDENGEPNTEAARAFWEYEQAIEHALFINTAPWAQSSHYSAATRRLREAREGLLSLADDPGTVNRLRLLAAIRDARELMELTTTSVIFTTGGVDISPSPMFEVWPGQIPPWSNTGWREPTHRTTAMVRGGLSAEALRAMEVAFNMTDFPIEQGIVNTRLNALEAEMAAFRRARELDEPLLRMHGWIDGAGFDRQVEEVIHVLDGDDILIGIDANHRRFEVETGGEWRWRIVGAPEGVVFADEDDQLDPVELEIDEDDPFLAVQIPPADITEPEVAPFWDSLAGWRAATIHIPAALGTAGDDLLLTSRVTFTVVAEYHGPEEDGAREVRAPINAFTVTLIPNPSAQP